MSIQTDGMADDLSAQLRTTDPAVGLRAVGALRRLAEMGAAGAARVAERHDVEREAAKLARYFHELSFRQKVN